MHRVRHFVRGREGQKPWSRVLAWRQARDPAVEVLIWTATGERAFSSGAALRGDKTVHVPKHALEDYVSRATMLRYNYRGRNVVS